MTDEELRAFQERYPEKFVELCRQAREEVLTPTQRKKREYMEKYLEVNKERDALRHKLRYEANRTKVLERNRQYALEHPEVARRANEKYRLANKEKRREYDSSRYLANKARLLERCHEYKQNNKDKLKLYVLRNSERIAEQHRKYEEAHVEERRQSHQTSRLRRAKVEGSYTVGEWYERLLEYDNRCVYCGAAAEDTPEGRLTPDHLIPIVRGGTGYVDNLVPACLQCNLEKNRMTADEFFESIDKGLEPGVTARRYISTHPTEVARIAKEHGIEV